MTFQQLFSDLFNFTVSNNHICCLVIFLFFCPLFCSSCPKSCQSTLLLPLMPLFPLLPPLPPAVCFLKLSSVWFPSLALVASQPTSSSASSSSSLSASSSSTWVSNDGVDGAPTRQQATQTSSHTTWSSQS